MKILFTLLFLTLTTLTFGQTSKPEPCGMAVADSPAIRGLKLGMPEADFKKKLGGNPDPIVTRYDLGKLTGFDNIQSIGWEMFNQRLMRLDVTYDDSVLWNSGAEFAEALSGPLNLPQASWKYSPPYVADLDCKEFTVSIDAKTRRVRLSDKTAQAAMKEDEKAKQADKKKTFKP